MRHAARQLPSWLIFDVGQSMTLPIKRLVASIAIPPTLGALLLFCFEILVDRLWQRSLSSHAEAFLSYWIYGLLFCLIPGLVFWAVFELIWKKRRHWVYRRLSYSAIGSLLGGCAGLIFALALGGIRFEIVFMHLVPVGLVVGFATAWICRGTQVAVSA